MSNNRITGTTTNAGLPPSTNGNPAGRGSPDPAHTPDRRSPSASSTADHHPPTNGRGTQQPSPSDDFGRFDPGNPLAPGNRFARLVAELRLVAVEAVPGRSCAPSSSR